MHRSLTFHNVELSYNAHILFHTFNASILTGSRIGIIGRNGSGKSSLLNLIGGRIDPTKGHIKRSCEEIIAYVPQHNEIS